MIVSNMVTATEPTYGDYRYPTIAIAFGWMLAFVSSLPILIMAITEICKAKGSFAQVIYNGRIQWNLSLMTKLTLVIPCPRIHAL